MNKTPVRVSVTGAGGQIGYALVFRIAAGGMLGPDQPIILQLLELPDSRAQQQLQATVMELEDCAFPLLRNVQTTVDPMVAFRDADVALLIGARPRGPGMQRRDLLLENARIFQLHGAALNAVAKPTVKVLVVGNPANTNALVAMRSAPALPAEQFTALTRLDYSRALFQLACALQQPVSAIDHLIIWGNHSETVHPDYRYATVHGQPVLTQLRQQGHDPEQLTALIVRRGARIIEARGASSAASAANAIVDHVRDWLIGSDGRWVAMAVPSDGTYGVPNGLVFGFPVTTNAGHYSLVRELAIDAATQRSLRRSIAELELEQHQLLGALR